ncbi:protein FAM3A-like [Ammospiza caudacuta]|uniref:protein FAM3A-like n=1 Tax=Ammospiza caudacuta TaxID=2857398 RepID=UPI0027388AEE|nr:protein FAM3A-like [Ammospiza caudacuta]
MLLTVKALQGRECSLQVSPQDSVAALKALVAERLQVPVPQQRLLYRGTALADDRRLCDYRIGPSARLNLVLKAAPRGGGARPGGGRGRGRPSPAPPPRRSPGVPGVPSGPRSEPPWGGTSGSLRDGGCDVEELLRFLRPLHEGTLVLVASYDDPATKLTDESRRLFGELGSAVAKDLGFRDSWVFLGAKGVQDRSPFEQHVRNSRGSNKYEGWPEALELGGCVPQRPPG